MDVTASHHAHFTKPRPRYKGHFTYFNETVFFGLQLKTATNIKVTATVTVLFSPPDQQLEMLDQVSSLKIRRIICSDTSFASF
jgi:hypothetical protein